MGYAMMKAVHIDDDDIKDSLNFRDYTVYSRQCT